MTTENFHSLASKLNIEQIPNFSTEDLACSELTDHSEAILTIVNKMFRLAESLERSAKSNSQINKVKILRLKDFIRTLQVILKIYSKKNTEKLSSKKYDAFLQGVKNSKNEQINIIIFKFLNFAIESQNQIETISNLTSYSNNDRIAKREMLISFFTPVLQILENENAVNSLINIRSHLRHILLQSTIIPINQEFNENSAEYVDLSVQDWDSFFSSSCSYLICPISLSDKEVIEKPVLPQILNILKKVNLVIRQINLDIASQYNPESDNVTVLANTQVLINTFDKNAIDKFILKQQHVYNLALSKKELNKKIRKFFLEISQFEKFRNNPLIWAILIELCSLNIIKNTNILDTFLYKIFILLLDFSQVSLEERFTFKSDFECFLNKIAMNLNYDEDAYKTDLSELVKQINRFYATLDENFFANFTILSIPFGSSKKR